MAGAAILYTETGFIRARAGVDEEEFDDTTLQSMLLDSAMETDFYKWIPDHADRWTASQAPTASEAEKQVGRLLRLYCTCFAALALLNTVLAVPQQRSNGKDAFKRYGDDALLAAIQALQANLGELKADLLALTVPDVVVNTGLFAIATPAVDPVTNS